MQRITPIEEDKSTLYFARKLIRPFGSATKEDIENEVNAIRGIFAKGGHENIITILSHGPLRSSDYYRIDMELCHLDLETYIRFPDRPTLFLADDKGGETGKLKPEYCVTWDSVREQRENIWTIVNHIASGLEFLHERKFAHRDLKPRNGKPYSKFRVPYFDVSSLFLLCEQMEDCGFRNNV
jgi:serine/threonine protein kinase